MSVCFTALLLFHSPSFNLCSTLTPKVVCTLPPSLLICLYAPLCPKPALLSLHSSTLTSSFLSSSFDKYSVIHPSINLTGSPSWMSLFYFPSTFPSSLPLGILNSSAWTPHPNIFYSLLTKDPAFQAKAPPGCPFYSHIALKSNHATSWFKIPALVSYRHGI